MNPQSSEKKSPYIHPKFERLWKQYNSVVQCNRCGFCETACPTYVVSGKETLSPRGRSQAFRQILEGKIKKAGEAGEIFSTCLTCHACTNVCFSQVPVAKLMGHARETANQSRKLYRFVESIIFRYFLYYRKIFSILIWTGFFFKRLGISAFLKKMRLLEKISPELSAGEELLENVPLRFGGNCNRKREKTSLEIKLGNSPPKVAYFSGCGIHYAYPKISQSCVNILKSVTTNLKCPNHACCGLTAQSAGDIKNAKRLAYKTIQQFGKLDTNFIVVNDDSCCGFMKNYGEFLEDEPTAAAFSKKVKNLSEFLAENTFSLFGSQPEEKVFRTITYHDPCQMGNGQCETQTPREVLKVLPGVKFIEMDESNWCCGGAGTYCLKHPHLAEDVLERKLSNIQKTDAEIVVTQAASCLLHIQYGIRKKGWQEKIKVLHLAELINKQIADSG